MQGHSPLEARSVASIAALPTVQAPIGSILDAEGGPILRAISLHQLIVLLPGRMIGLFALGTNPFAQTLGKYSQHGVGKVKRVAPEIQQPDHRFNGTVRMEGAEHQVASERGFNSDVGCFFIPHLADHDDIGVGAQKRPHRGREGEADLRMDLDLAKALLGDFNGIFGRPNLSLVGIDVFENRVKSCGFP